MEQSGGSLAVKVRMALLAAVIVLASMTLCCAEVFADDPEGPENNVINHDMQPGETYDCTDAWANTSVYIRQPGNYSIKGKSNNVMIMIESAGVNLYLENGLNLNCGAFSNIGARASAINIGLENGEPNGTVKIISRKNAKVYLEGYMAPAIQKNGATTELVFETENPNSPGTITAKGGVLSAAIGGVCYAIPTSKTTGRMVFNSGNIVATAGSDSAAIGGGYFGGVCDLTFNGGNIKAYGSEWGAAIGGGKAGDVESITINGGTIYAETDTSTANNAAAIGSGGEDDYERFNLVGNITINGGNITAKGTGTGIGAGGDECDLKHLTITGGTVNAQGTQPGASGIGAAGPGAVEDITINGGLVSASGGIGAPGIGVWCNSGGGGIGPAAAINVTINGGTVHASKGEFRGHGVNLDIGGQGKSVANVRINGGTLFAESVQNAKNAGGEDLHRVDIGFDGISADGIKVTDAVFSDGNMSYGTDTVCTNNGGKVYFWLPESDTALTGLSVNDQRYTGVIRCSDSQGTLCKDTGISNDLPYRPEKDAKFYLNNQAGYVARIKIEETDGQSTNYYYSDSCAAGQVLPYYITFKEHHSYKLCMQIWCLGWHDAVALDNVDLYAWNTCHIIAKGTIFSAWWELKKGSNVANVTYESAAIKASPTKVKKGKKKTVKVTSNSGAKLSAKAKNSKAKKALKKKYIKIKNGKTVKITFTKKAPKGTYKFKVTSPAKDKYKKTVKTITIKVK